MGKRKDTDGKWSARSERRRNRKKSKTQKTQTNNFTTAGLMSLMQSLDSAAEKAVLLHDCASPVKFDKAKASSKTTYTTPSKAPQLTFSSPQKGVETSEVFSPEGSRYVRSRILRLSKGSISLFLPSHKVVEKDLSIPPSPKPWINESPVPDVHTNGVFKVKINQEIILAAEREGPGRSKTQNQVMKIPANQALNQAGITVAPNTGHWVHFKSHSHFGNSTQVAENIGLGTRQANAAMEMVNRVIRKIVMRKTTPQELYLSYIPTWVKGYEKIRLLQSLEIRISDSFMSIPTGRKFSITFNMLSTASICESEIKPIEDALMNEFDGNEERLQPMIQTPIPPAPLFEDEPLPIDPEDLLPVSDPTSTVRPPFRQR